MLVGHAYRWLSLFFLLFVPHSLSACLRTRLVLSVRAPALPPGQGFDVRLTPARSPMAVLLCPACRGSDAVQKAFIALAWLRSQSRVQRPTDTSYVACRRLRAVQRSSNAADWIRWQSQSGSFNTYPPWRVNEYETASRGHRSRRL